MKLSYWEIKSWLTNIDFAVIGSGIVGLSCAIRLREWHPKAKIVIFERGQLPLGASTKNAGFACFGSMSEILDDLDCHEEEEVVDLIGQRIQGLKELRALLGDRAIGFQQLGGYEMFLEKEAKTHARCLEQMPYINALIAELVPSDTFQLRKNSFGYKGINESLIFNQHEGQIDTGKTMQSLLQQAYKKDILILNTASLESFEEIKGRVQLQFDSFQTSCSKLLIATNGFSSALVNEDVSPNRAQVLITEPIPDLTIKGTFHMDRGYYYFRNIDNRILLGGGRNLDFETEETAVFGLNTKIQNQLEQLLRDTILPNQRVPIAHRWAGILGMGKKKTSLVKAISTDVFCGIRLGGMGIAIGCSVGFQLAALTKE